MNTIRYHREFVKGQIKKIAHGVQSVYAKELKEGEVLDLVIVLNGGFMFGAYLAKQLAIIDPKLPVDVRFIKASSYGTEKKSSGKVEVDLMGYNPTSRNVLIAEDIIATGLTVKAIRKKMGTMPEVFDEDCRLPSWRSSPRTFRVATLVKVPSVTVDFYGIMHLSTRFLYGFGMDLEHLNRHLPDIWEVDECASSSSIP